MMDDQKMKTLLRTRKVGTERIQRNAAILLPVVNVAGEDSLLFEVRSQRLDMQPGEICFPGGRIEPGERPEDAAVREIWEELHVGREQVELLGPLDRMTHFSGTVFPLLGRLDPKAVPGIQLNEDEVEEAFTVPLNYFLTHPGEHYTYYLTPDNLDALPPDLADYVQNYRHAFTTPVWSYSGHTIWGMTARAVQMLLGLLAGN